jgi:RNA polymerase sigma-70 factor (ECF subfamily)
MAIEELVLPLCQPIQVQQEPMSADAREPSADIAALTARMVKGDEAAYRQFYELYFNRLLRYLLVVTSGREEAAREALQLTLLRVVRHIKAFTSEEIFWSWLTVLARSSVVDEERKRGRYASFLERFFCREQIHAEAADPTADAHLLAVLESQLTGLAEDERSLIERKYFAGESVKEIATETNATEKAIESRLVRIRRRLKELILAQLKNEKSI